MSTATTIKLHLNNSSRVSYDDPHDLVVFGGTINNPESVVTDSCLTVTFNDDGVPTLVTQRIKRGGLPAIRLFAGLRDDPFIRLPRKGRNIAAVVVELPLAALPMLKNSLLICATTEVPGPSGPLGDHAGRALRSMFNEPIRTPCRRRGTSSSWARPPTS